MQCRVAQQTENTDKNQYVDQIPFIRKLTGKTKEMTQRSQTISQQGHRKLSQQGRNIIVHF